MIKVLRWSERAKRTRTWLQFFLSFFLRMITFLMFTARRIAHDWRHRRHFTVCDTTKRFLHDNKWLCVKTYRELKKNIVGLLYEFLSSKSVENEGENIKKIILDFQTIFIKKFITYLCILEFNFLCYFMNIEENHFSKCSDNNYFFSLISDSFWNNYSRFFFI